jgi:hypothetical protein
MGGSSTIGCRSMTVTAIALALADGQFPVEQQIDGTAVLVTKLLCHVSPWLAGGSPIAAKTGGTCDDPTFTDFAGSDVLPGDP